MLERNTYSAQPSPEVGIQNIRRGAFVLAGEREKALNIHACSVRCRLSAKYFTKVRSGAIGERGGPLLLRLNNIVTNGIVVYIIGKELKMAQKESQQNKINELTALYEISQAISGGFDLRQALDKTLAVLSSRLGMNRGTVALLNRLSGEIEIETSLGLTETEKKRGRYRLGEGITGTVVSTGEPMVVPSIGKEPLFLNKTKSRGDLLKKDVSFICVPIKAGEEVAGALSVDRLFSPEVSFAEDVRLL
ncbi:GAF domain-containing protein [bacterium]|nr:MAG: GAF domain-containing protein [bacterium]